MSTAAVYGSNNITVVVAGNNDTINVCQRPGVQLWRPPKRAATHEREVLLSHLESIPFTARQTELDLVAKWLNSDDKISVLTLVGAGGTGKTRLALELFRRYEDAWSTGFITSFHAPNALAAVPVGPSLKQPLLAVVDYAATRTEDVRLLLEDLAQHGTHLPKLRLLLLERFADAQSGWYQRLFNYSQTTYTAGLFYQREPHTLTPVASTDDRRAIFAHCLDASAEFHASKPRPAEELTGELLGKPQFGDPLVVMMAALASWERGVYGALALSRPDLAVELARRERTRLGKRSASPLLAHLAAHSTLCGGFRREMLRTVAQEESEALGLDYAGGPGQLAADLAELLPGSTPGASNAIHPDIIGEAFVLDVQPEGISRAAHRNGKATVTTLTRALQDFYDPYGVRGENRLGIDGTQAVAWIRDLAAEAQAGDVELLLSITSNLPDFSLELAALAVELNATILGKLSAVGETAAQLQPERARLLNNYGSRLSALGRHEEALTAATEAVEICRKLAAARPDAFLPNLAGSLNNYGNRLSALGRHEEALTAAAEAVEICRKLAAARPDAFLPNLAMSLNNYGNRLSDLGRHEEALTAAAEAAEIYRKLAAARPDTFLPDLAGSLNNYGNRLRDLGRREEALTATAEAVEIYRKLAAVRPDAFLPDLAMSLNNYGHRLSTLGQHEKALKATAEAVEIYRKLTAARPDAFLPNLATALNNYGNMLSALGRHEEALAAAGEAVEIRRQLAAARPDAFLPVLATSLGMLGSITQDSSEARDPFHEAATTLLPHFLRRPQAHVRLMRAICSRYLEACEKSDSAPDLELLQQIAGTLESLEPEAPEESPND